jgi:hypothetical protein
LKPNNKLTSFTLIFTLKCSIPWIFIQQNHAKQGLTTICYKWHKFSEHHPIMQVH